tara:strand:+ start:130 stop:552 length:423 start_codon:yes stop_codon:yes gene_type:complete
MIFNIFKNKIAEKIASTIDGQYKKMHSLAKKDKIGMNVIKRSVFLEEFGSFDLKITKKFVNWEISVADVIIKFATEPKNKDEIYVYLQGICTSYPECCLNFICFDKKNKCINAVDDPGNKNGLAVKDILIKEYGWKDQPG